MGLEVLLERDDQHQRSRCRYQRLRGDGDGDGDGEEVGVAGSAVAWVRARRPLRLRRRVGKAAGRRAPLLFRMARPGGKIKVRLMRLVFLAPARRVAALFSELVRRLAASVDVAAECPTIVFSSQWGLPVLSHSGSGGAAGRTARLRAFYLERSLSAGSGSGGAAGSPC